MGFIIVVIIQSRKVLLFAEKDFSTYSDQKQTNIFEKHTLGLIYYIYLLLKLCVNVLAGQTKQNISMRFAKISVMLIFSCSCANVDKFQSPVKYVCLRHS